MDHMDLWVAIERFAHSLDMSCSALAKKSGLDATTFNKSKRWTAYGKPRWPSTHSIAKMLQSTNKSLDDFLKFLPSRADAAASE